MMMETVKIVKRESDKIIISDYYNRYQTTIPESFLQFGDINILYGTIEVSTHLFYEWFDKEIDKYKQRREESFSIIVNNIELLLRHYNLITNNPDYCNILAFDILYGTMHVNTEYSPVSLGELLSLWKKEQCYSVSCDCGGKGFVYYFGYSPLSGRILHSIAHCTKCGKKINGANHGLLVYHKYLKCKKHLDDVNGLHKLIAILKEIERENQEEYGKT